MNRDQTDPLEVSRDPLWQQIATFPLDDPNAYTPFSARLAREQGWTPVFTARVIEEYRRFIYLAMVAGHGVSPSKTIDEAWHLHLLYTRNYWEELCGKVLPRPLHHNPSTENVQDDAKYEGWYERTLASYVHVFNSKPPSDIWPSAEVPNRKKSRGWLAALLTSTLFLGGCGRGPNPLDWSGPEFLAFYLPLCCVFAIAAVIGRYLVTRQTEEFPTGDWNLSPYQIAFLNGGGELAVATAVGHLCNEGKVHFNAKSGKFSTEGQPVLTNDPLERVILLSADTKLGASMTQMLQNAKELLKRNEELLRRQGLWVRTDVLLRARSVPIGILAAPILLGFAKIAVGISRDRPVGFLIFIEFALLAGALGFLIAPKRSPYGNKVLSDLREKNRMRYSPPGAPQDSPDYSLAMMMGLYGLTALAHTPHRNLRSALVGSSSGGGDGGGGSSCSGDGGGSSCGGGGCGGGCGGCGS